VVEKAAFPSLAASNTAIGSKVRSHRIGQPQVYTDVRQNIGGTKDDLDKYFITQAVDHVECPSITVIHRSTTTTNQARYGQSHHQVSHLHLLKFLPRIRPHSLPHPQLSPSHLSPFASASPAVFLPRRPTPP